MHACAREAPAPFPSAASRSIRQSSRTRQKFYANVIGFTRVERRTRTPLYCPSDRALVLSSSPLGVGVMRNAMPLRWIEQAEARQVITTALFERAPKPPWSSVAGEAASQ